MIKRIAIVIGIAIAFSVGLAGAIILSLYSSQTTVPNIVGKDRASAENAISDARLNLRVRATRATSEAKPDTVLIQLPHAGTVVKVGQTVAVDISRPAKEGESSTPASTPSSTNGANENKPENSNASNSQTNSNDSKPKRKPSPRNLNANANANRSSNQNRNLNVNRTPEDSPNVNRVETPVLSSPNSNRPAPRANANRSGNTNGNRRPVAAPTPRL